MRLTSSLHCSGATCTDWAFLCRLRVCVTHTGGTDEIFVCERSLEPFGVKSLFKKSDVLCKQDNDFFFLYLRLKYLGVALRGRRPRFSGTRD